jgi:hypothetical protein
MVPGRRLTVSRLVLSSAAVAVVSMTWAWSSPSYWEAGPVVISVFACGIFAGTAVHIGWQRWPASLAVGVLIGLSLLVTVFATTSGRWGN